MQSNLYVTNLAYTITDDALRAHFESCGHVNSAQVIVERDTGRARGFGFVEMTNAQEAEAAIAGLNGL